MTYNCGAGMYIAAKGVKLLTENQSNQLLIIAHAELIIGYHLMNQRYELWNSIRWNKSRVGIKRDIQSKMSRATFDAKTSYLTAKSAFDEFMREVQISSTIEVNRLLEIHVNLYSIGEWFTDFQPDLHQISLNLILN